MQIIDVDHFPSKLGTDGSLEYLQHNSNKTSRMNQIEGLEVFLVLAVKSTICRPEPGEGGFVFAGQSIVKIDKTVVLLNKLVQNVGEISVNEW